MIAASSSSGAGPSASPAHSQPSSSAKACEASSSARVKAKTRRPWWQRDLADDVGAGAEAVEPEALRVAGHPQRAVADEPGAQQRRGLEVAEALGQREGVARVGHRARRVAAVAVEAGEARALAEVLAPAACRSGTSRRSSPATGCRRARPARARRSGPPPARCATIWWPGTTGSREPRSSPSRMCRSVRHTPQAWTSTSTSPGREGSSCGSGSSRACSGRPGSSRTIARTAT